MGDNAGEHPEVADVEKRAGIAAGIVLASLVPLALLAARPARAENGTVLVVPVADPITPVVADHLADAVRDAEEGGYRAVVVELDTPGGLDTSMRLIVQTFLEADVPVVVYVSPQGARAASAGTMITMAAHVAAMAPGTTIGAATPVDLSGAEISEKVLNDAAAYAVSIAERRGRSVAFAEAAVREGRAVSAEAAVEEGAVDLVAASLPELLDRISGREVEVGGTTVTLRTASATVEEREMGWVRALLGRIADPNIAYVLLSLGTLAIIYEVASPGVGLGGIAGVILLLLAFFALSVLPVDLTGILLMVLAAGLLIAEVFAPGVGVLAAGGTIALVLAGLFLFEGPLRVSWTVMVPTAVVVGLGVVVAGRLVWAARRTAPVTGPQALVGREAVVERAEGGEGQVFLEGSWWTVRAEDGILAPGEKVVVTGVRGLELDVRAEET